MTRLLPFALCLLVLSGCDAADTMKSGFEHSTAVSRYVERSVGAKSFVEFNWNNGSLTHVTITLETIPKGKSLEKITGHRRIHHPAMTPTATLTPNNPLQPTSVSSLHSPPAAAELHRLASPKEQNYE